jgi:hypothetical protein
MYADDVVTFLRPTPLDLHTCAAIMVDFGEASGLRTNLAKCSLHPIRCSPDQVELARGILGCGVGRSTIQVPWSASWHLYGHNSPTSVDGGQCGQTTAAVVCQTLETRGQNDSSPNYAVGYGGTHLDVA